MRILAAPTDTGLAPAGAKVRAVPVVPHREAASRMYAPPPGRRAARCAKPRPGPAAAGQDEHRPDADDGERGKAGDGEEGEGVENRQHGEDGQEDGQEDGADMGGRS
ncbi:MAG TPA: hypothetical protein VF069_03130 [Streptosporangiaceae bacterium]